MTSNPLDSSLQVMNIQFDILACLRPLIRDLKSDFCLSFSFSISGVICTGCWIQEVCVVSVGCEMLFNPIDSRLQQMKIQLNILACLRSLVHNLKSDFSYTFCFSVSGVIYIGHWIQKVCVISVVCEILLQSHGFKLTANEDTIGYLSMPNILDS